jgi:hypothetical protein
MGRLARIGTLIGAVLSVATQVQRWAKEHPEEAAAAKVRARRMVDDVSARQDLRGPRLIISARRDAGLVRSAIKNSPSDLDLPALELLRVDYVRLVNRIRMARRISDRPIREKQYDALDEDLAEMRFRTLEVFGHVQRQLPETD